MHTCGRVVIVGVLVCVVASLAVAQAEQSHFKIEQVADGVVAVISTDPLGLANHSNAVFIIGPDDVIVVDTQFTLARTREVLAALRKLTDKPVRAVINTHWHDDHTFGNQVYREAFPNAEIIAQESTKRDMETTGVENRANQVAGGTDALATFQNAIDTKTNLRGTAMGEDEARAYESTVEIAREYLDEQPGFHLTLPTRTFTDHLTLTQGTRVIEIHHFGPAVTRGDAAVYLPAEHMLIAGDLVDNPVPFAYGCDVDGWIAALDSLVALDARAVVPGHGEVMDGTTHVRRLREILVALRAESRSAAESGKSAVDVVRGDVGMKIRGEMSGGNPMLDFLCANYFMLPVVNSATQATGNPVRER